MKFYIAGIGNLAFFAKNNEKYYKNFRSYGKIYADDAETHFLAHY